MAGDQQRGGHAGVAPAVAPSGRGAGRPRRTAARSAPRRVDGSDVGGLERGGLLVEARSNALVELVARHELRRRTLPNWSSGTKSTVLVDGAEAVVGDEAAVVVDRDPPGIDAEPKLSWRDQLETVSSSGGDRRWFIGISQIAEGGAEVEAVAAARAEEVAGQPEPGGQASRISVIDAAQAVERVARRGVDADESPKTSALTNRKSVSGITPTADSATPAAADRSSG